MTNESFNTGRHGVRVTIGFCVKNVESTVKEAVDSIVEQSFPHGLLEVIVVDGFSEDRTLSIIKEKLHKSDVEYRLFQENQGLGTARQMVVDQARGKYIVWVDGDMILPENYVFRQVKFMERNSSVGIAGGKYGFFQKGSLVTDLENLVYVVDSAYGEKEASKFGHLPGAEGAIYRTEAIRDIGGFDVKIKGAAEDTDAACRMRMKGWRLTVTKETFMESTRGSWKALWKQYFWYGYGGHYVFHKNPQMVTLWKMTPPAGFAAGLIRSLGAYRLTGRSKVFLLPIHYAFKRTAWCFGFLKGGLDRYGNVQQN